MPGESDRAGDTFTISVPANPCNLKVIRGFFAPVVLRLFSDEADRVILALDEACSNVLKHQGGTSGSGNAAPGDAPPGNSACLSVRADLGPDSMKFRVGDYCCREDIPNIQPRELDQVRPGGLGTHFIDSIMDRVEFEPDPERPGRMAMVLEKKFSEKVR